MSNKFVVIDGSSLMYRAFYALPLLSTANGQYTNAVYGFAMMVVKILEDLQPDTLVVAFDKGKKTFRNEIFTEYKGTRKPMPTELVGQIPLIHELVEVLGIRLIEESGFEADDIIGTLATKAAAQGNEVFVVTGDKDALQLVRKNLKVMLTKKGISEMQVFDEAAFEEKYGLKPLQLIDLKGLMGDSSDNIPGVPGVGEKTATKLLLEYGSVENVLAHIDEVAGKKLQEKLYDNKNLALVSKKLATIICDMPLNYDAEKYKIAADAVKLKAFCLKYQFRSILSKIDKLFQIDDGFGFGTIVEELPPSVEKIEDYDTLKKVVAEIKAIGQFVFYSIFTGQVPNKKLEGIVVANKNGEAFSVSSQLFGWYEIIELFSDETIEKITHDFKPVYKAGIEVNGVIFDTMLAAYLLEPTTNEYNIKALLELYLDRYNQVDSFEDELSYGAWVVGGIFDLYKPLQAKLAEKALTKLYDEIELPLVEILASMENNGICVNQEALKKMSQEIAVKLEVLLKEIHALAGCEFNVNSPKQLGEVLFERLELPVIKKKKTGYSTDAEVLDKLTHEHPIVNKILEYRSWMKLKSTYLDGLGVLVNEETNRIYASFNQMVTATGRLSSSEPNLQNIPVRTEAGKHIRGLFVPENGYDYLLSADYSQIELRLLAHMSKDKNFIEAFTHNQDVHVRTAAEVFGVPLDEVTSELRSRAKAVNFGIVYGISDYGLSRDLNVTRKEAGEYIENYFAKCPGVKRFIDETVENAHRDGFVTTLFGRRRYLPDINSSNYNQRSFAERTAMNTPIQGTAADIIKKAMIDVYRVLKVKKLRSRILVQVHDELLLEVPKDEIEIVSELLKKAMQDTVTLDVPLIVDVHMGKNWAQAK